MTLSIDKKSKKSEYIYVSLLFDKLEPASGSRGGTGVAAPPHYALDHDCNENS